MSRQPSLARWLSIVLHPFAVFAVFALLVTAKLAPDQLARMMLGIALAILCVAAYITWRWKRGDWQTIDASDKANRPGLYLLLLVVNAVLLAWLGGPANPAGKGVLVVTMMLAFAAIANRWIKLSLHMASLAYTVPLLWALWPWLGVMAAALLPVLAWSRLKMKRHRLSEVLGGTVLGLSAGWLALLWQG